MKYTTFILLVFIMSVCITDSNPVRRACSNYNPFCSCPRYNDGCYECPDSCSSGYIGTSTSAGVSFTTGFSGSTTLAGGVDLVCPSLPMCLPNMIAFDANNCPVCSDTGDHNRPNNNMNGCPPVSSLPSLKTDCHIDRFGCLLCDVSIITTTTPKTIPTTITFSTTTPTTTTISTTTPTTTTISTTTPTTTQNNTTITTSTSTPSTTPTPITKAPTSQTTAKGTTTLTTTLTNTSTTAATTTTPTTTVVTNTVCPAFPNDCPDIRSCIDVDANFCSVCLCAGGNMTTVSPDCKPLECLLDCGDPPTYKKDGNGCDLCQCDFSS